MRKCRMKCKRLSTAHIEAIPEASTAWLVFAGHPRLARRRRHLRGERKNAYVNMTT